METFAGLILGIIIGSLIAWFALKQRASGRLSRLETEAELARQQVEETARSNSELREESDDWRNQAIEARTQVTTLEARVDAATQSLEDAAQVNAQLKADTENWRSRASESSNRIAGLNAQLEATNKRLSEQTDIEHTLLDQFKVMSSEVMSKNNETFLTSADEKVGTLVNQAKVDFDFSKEAIRDLVKPLSEELKRMEEARNTAQGSLKQQIETLTSDSKLMAQETRNLASALKRPEGRGTWGEIQLRRVVELAGMSEHCDYQEQVSFNTENGNRDRPDMIVNMPNERKIVIDAKTPLSAYLSAIESDTDEAREASLAEHADQVRKRVRELSQKRYWQLLDRSPEFVVMFLPGEFFLQPALEKDPELLDRAMRQGVIIATPTSLMALLRIVEMGWRETKLAEEAAKVGELGSELHDRLYTFATHMSRMRSSLDQTVQHFNSGVGSFETRVLVSARKFKELGISSDREIDTIEYVETDLRQLRSAPADAGVE